MFHLPTHLTVDMCSLPGREHLYAEQHSTVKYGHTSVFRGEFEPVIPALELSIELAVICSPTAEQVGVGDWPGHWLS
jgi:hypothetical protein